MVLRLDPKQLERLLSRGALFTVKVAPRALLSLPLGEGRGEGNDDGAYDLQFSEWRGRLDR